MLFKVVVLVAKFLPVEISLITIIITLMLKIMSVGIVNPVLPKLSLMVLTLVHRTCVLRHRLEML